MSTVRINLPEPPPRAPLGWCASCVAIYKGAIVASDEFIDEYRDADTDGNRTGVKTIRPDVPTGPILEIAVMIGVSALFPHLATGCCWTHAQPHVVSSHSNSKRLALA